MSPFLVSRNIGLRWNRRAAAERMTLSLGVYNDWLTTDPATVQRWGVAVRPATPRL
jgi:hypothetical protein